MKTNFKKFSLFSFLASALLFFPSFAHAQGYRYDNIALNQNGRPIANALIKVCAGDVSSGPKPCTSTTAVYSDAALTMPITQPIQTGPIGNYGFYANPGTYTISVYGPTVVAVNGIVTLPCTNTSSGCSLNGSIQSGTSPVIPFYPNPGLSNIVGPSNVSITGGSLNGLNIPGILTVGSGSAAGQITGVLQPSGCVAPGSGYVNFFLGDSVSGLPEVGSGTNPCIPIQLQYSKGPIPSYDAIAYGAVCNGNLANVTADSAGILAAINAAIAASPAGGIVNIDNCVWLPPNPLPTSAFQNWVILQARTGFTITGTLYLGASYLLRGEPNVGSTDYEFGFHPATMVTPSPLSISPVIEMVSSAATPMGIENISLPYGITGVGIEANEVDGEFFNNVNVFCTISTCQPLWILGGFGARIKGGSYGAGGAGNTNPSIRLSSDSATNDPIRDVVIEGDLDYLTLNYQGILIDTANGTSPITSTCSSGIRISNVLFENSTTSGNNSLVNADSTYNCIAATTIFASYMADSSLTSIFNSGSGTNAVNAIEVWLPVNIAASGIPVFSGSKTVSGIVHVWGSATAANIGGPFNGFVVDSSRTYFSCAVALPCSVIGGLAGDIDNTATLNVFKNSTSPTVANMSLNQRGGETGDLLDWKDSSENILGAINYKGLISTYNGQSTVDLGIPSILGSLDQTGVSTANSGSPQNVLASTPAAGHYRLFFYADQSAGCTTVTSGSLTIAAGWTDATHSRTSGTIATLTPGTADSGTGSFIQGSTDLWSAAGDPITLTATYVACSSGTWTYDVHATVEELK